MLTETHWHVIVPVRGGTNSKTRLQGLKLNAKQRSQLAQAFATDVVTVALGTSGVDDVTVITGDSHTAEHFSQLGAQIFHEPPGVGLNELVRRASEDIRHRFPHHGIAAVMGDIPGLTSEALAQALTNAASVQQGVLADHDESGTVMLTATGSCSLQPAYGQGSYSRHLAAGYVPIDVPKSSPVKYVVDTLEDLKLVMKRDIGAHTRTCVNIFNLQL